jgi:hypothetical protein
MVNKYPAHTEAEISRRLALHLRHVPDPEIVEQLRADGYLQAAVDAYRGAEFDDLLNEYRRLERFLRRYTAAKAKTAAAARPPGLVARLAPLEEIVFLEAERDEQVRAFRVRVLGGQLLAADDETVAQWFLAHVLGTRRPRGYIHAPHWPSPQWPALRPSRIEVEDAVAGHIKGEPQIVPGSLADNELDFLLCLVVLLQWRYGWGDGGEVERFLLCGERPQLALLSGHFQEGERFGGRSAYITIYANQAVSPRALARFYASYRALLAERRQLPRRSRDFAPRTVELALHVARSNDGRLWADMMALWNEEHPDDAFIDSRGFAQASHAAYRTIAGEELIYRGGPVLRKRKQRRPISRPWPT